MFTELAPWTRDFYQRSLRLLTEAGVPFLVGGAYALGRYTGVERHTKDLDLHVLPQDIDRTLDAFAAAGYRVERTFPHWLAKVYEGDAFVDLIYRSGNGLSEVDGEWFAYAEPGVILGERVAVTPAEELLWVKSFIQERERFDGADVAHLLRSRAEQLDWDRLLVRFGPHWRVLLGHLILFGYIYPSDRERVPARVTNALLDRIAADAVRTSADNGTAPVCWGTFLSREQYLRDVGEWGYRDARLGPLGTMTPGDVAHWTAAIQPEPSRVD